MNNYFIIETEEPIINRIIKVLDDLPDFNLIGCSHDASESMNSILKDMPDLIFINIDTSIDNPFELVKETKQYLHSDSEFIAISSSKEKTYDAIKTGFFDYLLNPVSELDIRKSILRFKKKHPTKLKETICLKSYKDYRYLRTDEILFLKADNNTTDFHMLDGNTINAFKTLKAFESILPTNFLRIHKSYIVNKNYVCRVNYGKLTCTIKKNNNTLPFTKTYQENIDFMVNTFSRSSALLLN
ncbi:LytR/AlgR family response regulator transcription factor [Snuella sedimenti]|uniref:Response regulator transcription factor n=1 Tax=Snuella sedimenti TaxID=2798802 RepID=A0A8J7IFC8_9FLAO|nr:LytTR family DNA-binding domain-containing protein [Snuella sedimenti]MBJ6367682.1 response regulator transcription factor [Snuella sedimenti]